MWQQAHTVQKVDEGAAPDCTAETVAAIGVWGVDGSGGLGCVCRAIGGGGLGRGAGAAVSGAGRVWGATDR
jgi:hypothetical protein